MYIIIITTIIIIIIIHSLFPVPSKPYGFCGCKAPCNQNAMPLLCLHTPFSPSHLSFRSPPHSVCLSLSPCLCLSVCLSPSVCLSVSVSLSLYLCLSISVCPSVCLSVCLSLSLSVSLSLSLSLSLSPSGCALLQADWLYRVIGFPLQVLMVTSLFTSLLSWYIDSTL